MHVHYVVVYVAMFALNIHDLVFIKISMSAAFHDPY